MSKRIPESKWIWLGYPQHFCAAKDCRFRLATIVGDKLISTVGDYHPGGQKEMHAIGAGDNANFETFVFRANGLAECGCCANLKSLSEIWGRRCATAPEAMRLHMEACRKFARATGTED